MSESRIKKIKKTARNLLTASPNLTPKQKAQVYLKTIKTMKKAKVRRHMLANIPTGKQIFSKKLHPGESLADFRKRRKACNKRRREREKLCHEPARKT